jgi:hypothetical protein
VKIPFTKDVPEFKPRTHVGQDKSLSDFEKEMLSLVDVIDQRSEYALTTSVAAYNGVLVVFGFIGLLVLLNVSIGPDILKALKSWLSIST